ncbi:MAG TPA: methionyl-tRNA formyltransferase [Bacteroidales bacterium]|nr:methionyl-tRNA formyltransferase [Bacteroidales bacterium]
MKNVRIVFMGTPEFAVATLGSLLMNGLNVVAVVTAPDKPAGRGRKLTKSAVSIFAEYSCLPVLQPRNLKDPEFIQTLRDLNADIFIVVAFRMLPGEIWKIPPSGTINLHASLLPHYRGAAPVNHVIINGESFTGVTTFLIDDKIDTGNILLREGVQIFPFENAGDLHDRLMKLGARLVIRTLKAIYEDHIIPMPQSAFLRPGEVPETAPKIFPENCIINWHKETRAIHNLIRGLSPYPGARSFLNQGNRKFVFKIFESRPEKEEHQLNPGSIVSDGKNYLKIACNNGFINIITLQLEGRDKMNITEFMRGFNISDYTISATGT